MTDEKQEVLLTDVQVAEMLEISVRTVQSWRLKKTGPPFIKIGRLVRYDRSKIQSWFGISPKREHRDR